MDHDQRFKTLIQGFFPDYLRLFHPQWAERLDASAVEWLEQEIFPDPPEGRRRVLDLVGKLPTRKPVPDSAAETSQSWMALVHIEIESADRAASLRPRMFDAYVQLRRKHRLPVLPIGIFLHVGLDGVGVDVYEEQFWELRPLRFEYLYVGLPALDALEYLAGENWLGVALAALMRIPKGRTAWLGAEALRRIVEAPLTEQARFLLGECVQAYLPLNDVQRREFDRLLRTPPYRGVHKMNATWFEKGEKQGLRKGVQQGVKRGIKQGVQQGVQQGLDQGRRELLQALLEEKFGPLSPTVVERLQRMRTTQLIRLSKAILRARSLKELGLAD